MAADDPLATALEEIRERHERARHPEDDDGKIYIAAAAVAVALGEAPGWTVRRSGVSVEVYEDGRGVPAWRVWVERGRGGHLIGDGEFGRSARDVPRLLAAVEEALKLAGKWECEPIDGTSALTEDRDWVRADCGAGLRETITRALLGEEAPDGQ